MRHIATLGLAVLAMTALVERAQAQPGGGGGTLNVMQFADTDKDGKVSLAEFSALADRRWQRISQGADKVKPADLQGFQANALAGIAPDADGYVSKTAYQAATPARFKAADGNGDGSLSEAELAATMPRRPGGN